MGTPAELVSNCTRAVGQLSFVICLLFFGQIGRNVQAAAGTEKEGRSKIEYRVGKIIPERELPALYKSLNKMLDRLGEAQLKLDAANARFVTHNQLFIVNSDAPGAYVLTLQREAVPGQRNMVVITTALIDVLFSGVTEDNPEASLQWVTTQFGSILAGISSHELAHPVFYQDFSNRKSTRQAEEVLADHRGVQIAELAGYPRQGLLQGLAMLNRYEDRILQTVVPPTTSAARRAAEQGLSTHPQKVLRDSHLRTLLMIKKMREGSTTPSFPEPQTQAMLAEVQKIVQSFYDKIQRATFAPLSSDPRELLERVTQIINSRDQRSQFAVSEANLILIEIDRLIAEGRFPESLEPDLFSLLQVWIASDTVLVGYEGRFANKYREIRVEIGSDQTHSHKDAVFSLPFFRSESWKHRFRQAYPEDELVEALFSSGVFLPPDAVFEIYGQRIVDFATSSFDKEHGHYDLLSWMRRLSFSEKLRWSRIFHESIIPRLKPSQIVYFLNLPKLDRYSDSERFFDPMTFLLMYPNSVSYDDAKRPVISEIDAHFARVPSDLVEFTILCQSIWDQRAFYILFDFQNPDGTVMFWDLIFKTLGMSQAEGHAQLNHTLIDSLKTPFFHDVLAEGRSLSKKLLEWVAPQTLLAIRNEIKVSSDDLYAGSAEGYKNHARARRLRFHYGDAHAFARVYIGSPETFRLDFANAFEQALMNIDRELTPSTVETLVQTTFKRLMGFNMKSTDHGNNLITSLLPAPIEDLVASALWKTSLSLPKRQALLDSRYLKWPPPQPNGTFYKYASGDFGEYWVYQTMNRSNDTVFGILRQAGLVVSPSQIFMSWRPLDRIDPARNGYRTIGHESDYLRALTAFDTPIFQEIESTRSMPSPKQRARVLLNMAHIFLSVTPRSRPWSEYQKEFFRECRARIVEIALITPMPLIKRVRLFEALTASGSVSATDDYFKTAILPELEVMDSTTYHILTRALSDERFSSQTLAIEMGARVLKSQASSLKTGGLNDQGLLTFLERVNTLLPVDSLLKDDLVEDLSWDLDLQEDRFLQLMESHKTVNWRRLNPQLVNWASFISEHMGQMSRSQIRSLIDYLIDPVHRDLPAVLDLALLAAANETVTEATKGRKVPLEPTARVQMVKEATEQLKFQFATMARDSSPMDRVPIFDLLLHSGTEPYSREPGFPFNVIEEILDYPKGSAEEVALRSWLETVPPEDKDFEPSLSVAFQISTKGTEKSSIKSGFELFETVGKKTGQAASILEVFDPAINAELADLKDNKRGMSKVEIKARIVKQLGHGRFRMIRRLGSASIKTVVLIQIEGEEKLRAVHLRNPGAKETLTMHIARAKAYVARLAVNGLAHESELFNAYIEALEQSIPGELNFRNEGQKYAEMAQFFFTLNRTLGRSMNGWKFSVPGVDLTTMDEDFLMTDYADGDAFDEIPPGEEKDFVGDTIFNAMASGLLRYGQFEPDRHVKNIKVNSRSKQIHMIDPGQFQKFSTTRFSLRGDDRSAIAKFFLGVSSGNTDLVLRALEYMKAPHAGRINVLSLRSDMDQIMKGHTATATRILEIVKLTHRKGLILDFRFSFSAFKGLLVLVKEKYVDPSRVDDLLAPLIRNTLLRNFEINLVWQEYRRRSATTNHADPCKPLLAVRQ